VQYRSVTDGSTFDTSRCVMTNRVSGKTFAKASRNNVCVGLFNCHRVGGHFHCRSFRTRSSHGSPTRRELHGGEAAHLAVVHLGLEPQVFDKGALQVVERYGVSAGDLPLLLLIEVLD
jgi:hypothetical protein